VDIFDASSGRWSTAALSVARRDLAATSFPNLGVAVFAGGLSMLLRVCSSDWFHLHRLTIQNVFCFLFFYNLMCGTAEFGFSNAVDIYNAKSGSWSTAALSSARSLLSSATLPDLGVVFFAGGFGNLLL
jgi:hypothetical protein